MCGTEHTCGCSSSRIAAVLVLYRLKPSDSITLTSFCSSLTEAGLADCFRLLIYDNSPFPSEVPADIPVPVTYIHNPSNGGLFAAYDAALKSACEDRSDWMLLLDQDTVLNTEYLKALRTSLSEAAQYPECAAFVPKMMSNGRIISPLLIKKWGRMVPVAATRERICSEELTALNSGSLIRISAIQRIGGFNPLFWLDYQDHWIFNRLYHAGFSVCVLDAVLTHDLSVRNMKKMPIERYKNILSAEDQFYLHCKSSAENRVYALRLIARAVKMSLIPGMWRLCLLPFKQFIARLKKPVSEGIAGMCMERIGKVLLIAVVVEASLGGGGRLINTGFMSPRMVLFGLGVVYWAACSLRRQKIPMVFASFVWAFLVLSGISFLVSAAERQPVSAVFRDFKPLAYFLLLPFFALTIRNRTDVALVSRIWKSSALLLSVVYLLVMLVWKTGLLTTEQLFSVLNPTCDHGLEFSGRAGVTFFFKALLYVGVGVFFFLTDKSRLKFSVIPVLLLTILITMTRGVWLAVFMVSAAWAFLFSRPRIKGMLLAICFGAAGLAGLIWISLVSPTVEQSNAVRTTDMQTISNTVWSWQTALFGRGFGADVVGREAIEITYVNVFFKQGLIGILFWMIPPVFLFFQARRMRCETMRTQAMPYLLSVAFVYLVSLTNPFLANPLGLSVVLIAMAVVRVIGLSDRRDAAAYGSGDES